MYASQQQIGEGSKRITLGAENLISLRTHTHLAPSKHPGQKKKAK